MVALQMQRSEASRAHEGSVAPLRLTATSLVEVIAPPAHGGLAQLALFLHLGGGAPRASDWGPLEMLPLLWRLPWGQSLRLVTGFPLAPACGSSAATVAVTYAVSVVVAVFISVAFDHEAGNGVPGRC